MLSLLTEIKAHEEIAWHVAWNKSGTVLATSSSDKTVKLWRYNASKNGVTAISTLESENFTRTVRASAFNCDDILATACFDSTVGIYRPVRDAETGSLEYQHVCQLEGHENEVKSVAWSPSGSLLATCSRDKSVWIWLMDGDCDFECIAVLQSHTQDVKMVRWHPELEVLISCGYDNTIRVWKEDEEDWFCAETLKTEGTVWAVDWLRDVFGEEYKLVSVGDDLTVRLWALNAATHSYQEEAKLSNHHARQIYSVSVHDDLIATCSANDDIKIMTRDLQQVCHIPQAHDSDVNCVCWAPRSEESPILASVGDDGMLKLWKFIEAK